MSGTDELAAAIKGPNTQAADREITGYDGLLTQVTSNRPDGAFTGTSQATVTVGPDNWVVTRLSGPFVAELAGAGVKLIGRTVRVHMVNGQPEIAYTVDPSATGVTGSGGSGGTGTQGPAGPAGPQGPPGVGAAGTLVEDPANPGLYLASDTGGQGIFLGEDAVVEATTSTTIDGTWKTSTTVQTIGAVTGCTVKMVWRTTIDRVVEWRVLINVPAPYLGATPYLSCTVPNVFPFTSIDAPAPVGQGPHGSGVGTAPNYSLPLPIRIDPGAPPLMWFFMSALVSGTSYLEGSGTFTITKP